jgi:hypothetical protein
MRPIMSQGATQAKKGNRASSPSPPYQKHHFKSNKSNEKNKL